MCIKCSSNRGTLSHLFVFCRKLKPFWNCIFDFLSKVIGRSVPCTPLTVLFGVTDLDWTKNKGVTQVISLCTLLARKLILLCWKSDKRPSFEMWLKDLGNVLHFEKITYTLANRLSVFFKIWQPFFSFLDKLK